MSTGAHPLTEGHFCPDEPRTYSNVREPFMVTHRMLEEGSIKIIWWYVVAIDEEVAAGVGKAQFETQLFGFDEAFETLTYQLDQNVVRAAIDIVNRTPLLAENWTGVSQT